MGLGDTLIKLHVRYGSEASLKFINRVYALIRDEAYRASVELSREKGAFAKFDAELYPKSKFIMKLPADVQKTIKKQGIRNSVLLMQAPTGTTSLIATTTSGIEPVYEFEFTRRSRLGEDIIRHHLYDKWYAKHGEEMKAGKLKRPAYFVSANDLSPEDHVRVQAAIQQYVDASISKTVNAPEAQTVEEVKRLYTLAYDLGCKGIAYMREGSRQGVLERAAPKKEEAKEVAQAATPAYQVKPRPMMVQGATYEVKTPVGDAFITINTNGDGEPLEVFVNVGKAGTDVYAMAEGLGRILSLSLRLASHVPPRERVKQIIYQLQGIGGARSLGFGKDRIKSLPDAVAKVLTMHFSQEKAQMQPAAPNVSDTKSNLVASSTNGSNGAANGNTNGSTNGNGHAPVVESTPKLVSEQPALIQEATVSTAKHYDLCPACGEALLAHEEGCKKCYGCGFSEC
jgi:ribonucleoside-diphosphate reductase alpha chain